MLRPNLTLDHFNNFCAGIKIKVKDLERNMLTGELLIAGRSLLSLAKKGVYMYRKALAHAMKKWDLTNNPIYSGDTLEDIIAYVHLEMYRDSHGVRIVNNPGDVLNDDDEDNNDVDDEEDACMGNNTPFDGDNTDGKSDG